MSRLNHLSVVPHAQAATIGHGLCVQHDAVPTEGSVPRTHSHRRGHCHTGSWGLVTAMLRGARQELKSVWHASARFVSRVVDRVDDPLERGRGDRGPAYPPIMPWTVPLPPAPPCQAPDKTTLLAETKCRSGLLASGWFTLCFGKGVGGADEGWGVWYEVQLRQWWSVHPLISCLASSCAVRLVLANQVEWLSFVLTSNYLA